MISHGCRTLPEGQAENTSMCPSAESPDSSSFMLRSPLQATCLSLTAFLAAGGLVLTAPACNGAPPSEQVAVVTDTEISESSGLAVSRRYPDAVWLHNDSGDSPRLFLVGRDGRTRTEVAVRKAKALDWEDMCSFEVDGQPWLLVGDIGDNERNRGRKRPSCRLYLLKEPRLKPDDRRQKTTVDIEIEFEYPEGPQNCESVAVDTEQKEILLLTKSAPAECRLYRLPLNLEDRKQQLTAELIASLPIPFATGMDVSADSKIIAVVSMGNGLIIRRPAGRTWQDAVRSGFQILELPHRRQGETICFEPDGQSVLVNSEFQKQPLWRIQLSGNLPSR